MTTDPLSLTLAAIADPTRRAILVRLSQSAREPERPRSAERASDTPQPAAARVVSSKPFAEQADHDFTSRAGWASVTELARPFNMTMPAITKHLKVLERAGLIERGREAQWRPCRLRAEPLRHAAEWIDRYRAFWEASFDRLDEYLKELQSTDASTALPLSR